MVHRSESSTRAAPSSSSSFATEAIRRGHTAFSQPRYERLSKSELLTLCTIRNILSSGNKATLISRLDNYDQVDQFKLFLADGTQGSGVRVLPNPTGTLHSHSQLEENDVQSSNPTTSMHGNQVLGIPFEVRRLIMQQLVSSNSNDGRRGRLDAWDDIVAFRLMDEYGRRMIMTRQDILGLRILPYWLEWYSAAGVFQELKVSRPLTVLFHAFQVPPPHLLDPSIVDGEDGAFFKAHIAVRLHQLNIKMIESRNDSCYDPEDHKDPRNMFCFPPQELEKYAHCECAKRAVWDILAVPKEHWWVLRDSEAGDYRYRPTLLISHLLLFWFNSRCTLPTTPCQPGYRYDSTQGYSINRYPPAFCDAINNLATALRKSFALKYFLTGDSVDLFTDFPTHYPENHFFQNYLARYGVVILLALIDLGHSTHDECWNQRLHEVKAAANSIARLVAFLTRLESYCIPPVKPVSLVRRWKPSAVRWTNPRQTYDANIPDSEHAKRFSADEIVEHFRSEVERFSDASMGFDLRCPELNPGNPNLVYPLGRRW
ncbi:hypothetical protein BJ508DRAFT_314682 [Ascobolus immersus RN42]|uniref:SAP domain-containing protein n=1 Tax=Ascobolus immersus RN42 TaxID=1160509 RepID=A0A3N4HE25_ASCIM|nr:hypothetical protein BJ508DRAFT_314682 [Ascobolus immersus RN42]